MIRTLVAESVPLMRVGLLALLAQEPDIEVVAELDRPEAVVPAARQLEPDVALVDAALAAHDGFAPIKALHASVPACGLVIMASGRGPGEMREAIAARAEGYVAKDSDPDKITEAIRRVAAGKKALDPDLAFSTFNSMASPTQAVPANTLTRSMTTPRAISAEASASHRALSSVVTMVSMVWPSTVGRASVVRVPARAVTPISGNQPPARRAISLKVDT